MLPANTLNDAFINFSSHAEKHIPKEINGIKVSKKLWDAIVQDTFEKNVDRILELHGDK